MGIKTHQTQQHSQIANKNIYDPVRDVYCRGIQQQQQQQFTTPSAWHLVEVLIVIILLIIL